MNIDDLQMVPDPDPAATARKTRDLCIAEGRAAYRAFRAGLGIRLPTFRDPDMRIDWLDGWRWEAGN